MWTTLTYCALLIGIIGGINCAAVSTNSTKKFSSPGKKVPVPTNAFFPYAYAIDLSSCHCQPFDKRCEVSIGKSIIMDKTINCPEDHHYCCKGKSLPQETDSKNKSSNPINNQSLNTTTNSSSNQIATSSPPNQFIPRVHIHIPSLENSKTETLNPLPTATNPNALGTPAKPKPPIKCRCKVRDECESKYTDYTFGFHCSYNKVHCCEPQDEIKKEMNIVLGTRVIQFNSSAQLKSSENLTGVSGLTQAKPLAEQIQCVCLSQDECSRTRDPIGTNALGEQKDTLCPFHLVKCCGTPISKRSDTLETVEMDEVVDTLSSENTQSAGSEGTGIGKGVEVHGLAAFLQPIQLQLPKIPSKEELHQNENGMETATPTSSVQPPQLPTSYHPLSPADQQQPPFSSQQPTPSRRLIWGPSPYPPLPTNLVYKPIHPNAPQSYGISSRSDLMPTGTFVPQTGFPLRGPPRPLPASPGWFSAITNLFG